MGCVVQGPLSRGMATSTSRPRTLFSQLSLILSSTAAHSSTLVHGCHSRRTTHPRCATVWLSRSIICEHKISSTLPLGALFSSFCLSLRFGGFQRYFCCTSGFPMSMAGVRQFFRAILVRPLSPWYCSQVLPNIKLHHQVLWVRR